jgi:hypothetical protein
MPSNAARQNAENSNSYNDLPLEVILLDIKI